MLLSFRFFSLNLFLNNSFIDIFVILFLLFLVLLIISLNSKKFIFFLYLCFFKLVYYIKNKSKISK